MSGVDGRRLWARLEAYHAVVYFAPEVREAVARAGMKGFWMGYFAGRAAPLGAVGPEVVTALFHGFRPSMVARALPDAWSFCSPGALLAARLGGVDQALRRILGDAVTGEPAAFGRGAELAVAAGLGGDPAGRALFAAHAALPVPAEPHLALWHGATLFREHRGDGHVAVLTAAGLDGCAAHVLQVAGGRTRREVLQPARGWTDEEWRAAEGRLAERGWVEDSAAGAARLTPQGREALDEIEATTDRLSAAALAGLEDADVAELFEWLGPLARAVAASGTVPYPNPIGVDRP